MNQKPKPLKELISDYAIALDLIDRADRHSIPAPSDPKKADVVELKYQDLLRDIDELRGELNLGELFAQDNHNGLESILKSINQSYDNKPLYPSVESKAANLLYLIIKNHPFVDGNKKVASFAFVRYLDLNGLLYREDGTKRIDGNTLVTTALLLAQSNMKDKELMISLVMYLIEME